jgi:hypothetical protein
MKILTKIIITTFLIASANAAMAQSNEGGNQMPNKAMPQKMENRQRQMMSGDREKMMDRKQDGMERKDDRMERGGDRMDRREDRMERRDERGDNSNRNREESMGKENGNQNREELTNKDGAMANGSGEKLSRQERIERLEKRRAHIDGRLEDLRKGQ